MYSVVYATFSITDANRSVARFGTAYAHNDEWCLQFGSNRRVVWLSGYPSKQPGHGSWQRDVPARRVGMEPWNLRERDGLCILRPVLSIRV